MVNVNIRVAHSTNCLHKLCSIRQLQMFTNRSAMCVALSLFWRPLGKSMLLLSCLVFHLFIPSSRKGEKKKRGEGGRNVRVQSSLLSFGPSLSIIVDDGSLLFTSSSLYIFPHLCLSSCLIQIHVFVLCSCTIVIYCHSFPSLHVSHQLDPLLPLHVAFLLSLSHRSHYGSRYKTLHYFPWCAR